MRLVITHTDLDGVASAAIISRRLGKVDKYIFTQPHILHRAVSAIRCSDECEIYICDLSPNSSNYPEIERSLARLVSSGVRVRWFDHHVWERKWIERLLDIGVELSIDTTTCSAGVVFKYLGDGDPVSRRIAEAACSLDMWVFNDWLGNFLARYVGFSRSENWRRRVVERLTSGHLLDEDVLKVVEDSVDRELKILSEALRKSIVREVCGVRVAYYYKSVKDHITSYVAATLMSRYGADVAVICRKGSVSLRSTGAVDVREVAKKLGGGGHPNAAGFSINPPLLLRVLIFFGIRGPFLRWCMSKIEKFLC